MTIHHYATEGFAAGAATYARGRPDYPPPVEQWLRGELALGEGRSALELGAGTGKFLPRLRATGARVIALEPVAAMLAQLRRLNPGVEAIEASAQRIPLAGSSVDAVICAQSFHWFAGREALAEIRRVLRRGGVLGLIWNVRDESVPWVAALTRIITPYEGDAPRYHTQAWRPLFPTEGFGPLLEREFPNSHTGSAEKVILERVLSISFIAALPPADQNRVAAQVRQLIASSPDLAGASEVTFPYKTRAFSCTKVG